LRHPAKGIDEADLVDAVAPRQCVRERAANRAASDDGNEGHETLFYRDDAILCTRPQARRPRHRRFARHWFRDRGSADRLRADSQADVQNERQALAAVEQTAQRFGGLDVLVNNAGVGLFSSVADMSAAEWRQVIDTNLTGVFYCCHAAIPHMRKRGGGWIINISSLASKNPFVNGAAYCASKSALNAFSEALMQELRHDNIRVSDVMPGSVSTGFGGRAERGVADWKLAPDDVAKVVVDLIDHPARSLPSRVELRPSRPPK
jgi:3-oxoacyl-[acyl-carrier protein] reductase